MKRRSIFCLRSFACLWEMDRRDLKSLLNSISINSIKKGETLVFSHYDSNKLLYVKRGIFKVGTHLEDGREYFNSLAQTGDFIGSKKLLPQKMDKDEFAVALEDSLICFIELSSKNWLLNKYPKLNELVLNIIGTQVVLLEQQTEAILFKSSNLRVVDFLQSYFDRFGNLLEDKKKIRARNYLTHTDVAKLTRTSRQTVNSVFNTLRREYTFDYNNEWMWISKESLSSLDAGFRMAG